MRVPIKYDYRDLILTPVSFSGLEIVDAGSGEINLTTEVLFFSDNFSLNTQSDGLGTDITGFNFVQKNSRMTTQWGFDVYEGLQITDITYQTGTIYAFGDIAGSIVGADDPNRLQSQIDQLATGTINKALDTKETSGTSGDGDLLSAGYKQEAFDNAISQANYPASFAKIGHKYNAQHFAAGDADLSASGTLFYPTPVPGAYGRGGIPDIEFTDSDVSTNFINFTPTWTFRSGTKYKYSIISGSPVSGLVNGTEYWFNFNANELRVYDTNEADAIAKAINNKAFTAGSGTFRLTQEGIAIDDAFQSVDIVSSVNPADKLGTDSTKGGASTVNGNGRFTASGGVGGALGYEFADNGNGAPRATNETRPQTNHVYNYWKVESITPSGETVSALRYDTGWIANSDWTNFSTTVQHGLNSKLDNLIPYLLVSADGIDGFIVPTNGGDVTNVGYSFRPGSDESNNFILQTGALGITFFDASGLTVLLDTEAWYYKVVVIKPNLTATAFDVSNLPQTFDISATTENRNLPALQGLGTIKSYDWHSGDGSNIFSAIPSGTEKIRFDDGTEVSNLDGKGNGSMAIQDVGSHWKIINYRDSGSNADGTYEKRADRSMVCKNDLGDFVTNLGLGSVFVLNPDQTWTFPQPFEWVAIGDVIVTGSGHNKTWTVPNAETGGISVPLTMWSYVNGRSGKIRAVAHGKFAQ